MMGSKHFGSKTNVSKKLGIWNVNVRDEIRELVKREMRDVDCGTEKPAPMSAKGVIWQRSHRKVFHMERLTFSCQCTRAGCRKGRIIWRWNGQSDLLVGSHCTA